MRVNASSGTVSYAATIAGSNCVPAAARITWRASDHDEAGRYGRSVVRASSVSATAKTRAWTGICSPASASG